MIIGGADLSVVQNKQTFGFLYRSITDIGSFIGSAIHLAVSGVAQIKAFGLMLSKAFDRITFGAQCLRFQSLNRPGNADFIGYNAFYIIRQPNHVDDIHIVAAYTVVFKAAIIFITLEPGLLAQRLNAQWIIPQHIKLINNLGSTGEHNRITGLVGNTALQRPADVRFHVVQLFVCRFSAGILPNTNAEAACGITEIGVIIFVFDLFDHIQCIFQIKVFINLQAIGTDLLLVICQRNIGIGAAGKPEIGVFQNGDLIFIVDFICRNKFPVFIIISKGIAGVHAADILQIGSRQRGTVVIQANFYGRIITTSLCCFRKNRQQKAHGQQDTKEFFHGAPQFRSGIKCIDSIFKVLYRIFCRNSTKYEKTIHEKCPIEIVC